MFTTSLAFAQSSTAQQQALHEARAKIWAGIGLLASGAMVMPVTATGHTSNQEPPIISVGLIAAGSAFLWVGMRDQRKAMQPQTTVSVMIGKANGIQIRRRW